MTSTSPSSRGLAGAFGAPPGSRRPTKSAAKPKPTKPKTAKKKATAKQQTPAAPRRARRTPLTTSSPAKPRTKPRALEAPLPSGPRTRRSVRIPMRYLRRCAIIKGHLGLSQGDILMAAYAEWGAAMLDSPDHYIEQWSRRRSIGDAADDGRENLQPLLTSDERKAIQELVDATAPAGSWPKVVVELLDRHLPTLEQHL